jgi:hypothetical protein
MTHATNRRAAGAGRISIREIGFFRKRRAESATKAAENPVEQNAEQ